jgi:aquaporin Z
VLPYMIAQLLGAAAAAFTVSFFIGEAMPEMAASVVDVPKALLAEFLGTFALAYVVLNVATSKNTTGNSFYGLAIGFTVFIAASGLGMYSGGAFNPAVALGVSIMKLANWADIWIYLLSCFGGAALAAVVFNWVNNDDK